MDLLRKTTLVSVLLGQGLLMHFDVYAADVEADKLEVKLNSELKGNLEVKGNTELKADTVIGGSSTLNGATTISNTLGVTGATTLSNSLGVTGATTLSNTLGVTGATTLSNTLGVTGATTLSNTLGVTGATTLSNTLGVTGATTLNNTLGVTGTTTLTSTNINDDLVLDSNGASAGGSQLTVTDTSINLQSASGSTTLKGGTQSGILYLNDGDASNTGGPDGTAITISGSATSNPAATVFQTTTDAQTTQVTTRIGTSNTLYNQSQVYTQAGGQQILVDSISGITANAHNGQMQMLLNQVQLTSGSMGLNSFATSRQLTSNTSTSSLQQLVHGNSYTRSSLQGTSINNQISGNTAIDGNLYVNGNVTVAATSSSEVKVINSEGVAGLETAVTGSSGLTANANGALVSGTLATNATSLSVKSANGYSGLLVGNNSVNLSAGNNAASMRLDSSGLTLSNTTSGAPVQIHGVAAGVNDYDAVNVAQLKATYAGIASSNATANIPGPTHTPTYVGVGLGSFGSESAIAIGVRTYNQHNHISSATTITYDSQNNLSVGVGIGWGF